MPQYQIQLKKEVEVVGRAIIRLDAPTREEAERRAREFIRGQGTAYDDDGEVLPAQLQDTCFWNMDFEEDQLNADVLIADIEEMG